MLDADFFNISSAAAEAISQSGLVRNVNPMGGVC